MCIQVCLVSAASSSSSRRAPANQRTSSSWSARRWASRRPATACSTCVRGRRASRPCQSDCSTRSVVVLRRRSWNSAASQCDVIIDVTTSTDFRSTPTHVTSSNDTSSKLTDSAPRDHVTQTTWRATGGGGGRVYHGVTYPVMNGDRRIVHIANCPHNVLKLSRNFESSHRKT